jgi:hypothetical protein
MNKSAKISHSVLAAAKDGAWFKAVELRKQDGVVEVVRLKSLASEGRTWTDFAVECGLTAGADERDKAARRQVTAVVGLDSTGVSFYRVNAPAVGEHETAAIVRMQAEALLPLPADQIEVAWRTRPSTNGNVHVTVAAARKEYLQRFAGSVQDFQPDRILLSCEGMAQAWQSLFADGDRQGLVVSIGADNTQICLVQDGLVTQAAVLDTGMADLARAGDSEEPAGVTGRFAQDMRVVLASFGWEESSAWPVLVLSDGSEALARIVESLRAAGLPAKAATPEARGLRLPPGFELRDLYEYRVPFGLALAALETPATTLDLFTHIREARAQQKAKANWYSLALAGGVAVVMLLALLVTWRSVDIALARRLNSQVTDPNFEAARQHQTLLKTVARHRADLLQLLADLNPGASDGILLDSIHFKKGQPVSISGQAGNAEQMYKYQAGLRQQKAMTDVQISNAASDPKTKKIKFTMTFHYKNFTKKDAVL